jgi:lipopolysaccharide export system permease protein
MHRLTLYIFRQMAGAAVSILVLVVFLGWLSQVLTNFALVTGKGQSLVTLVAHTGLLLPTIVDIALPISVMLGMTRVLRAMSSSRELHMVHAAGRIGALWGAAALTIVAGVVALTLSANIIKPLADRAIDRQLRQINADLISQATVTGRFIQIEPGVTMRIDGRAADGTIEGFFLHDGRSADVEQTVYARAAAVTDLDDGIDVRLDGGSLQFLDRQSGFVSAVRFEHYQLGVADLVAVGADPGNPAFQTTPELLAADASLRTRTSWRMEIDRRLSQSLFVVSFAVLATLTMGFPGGAARRRRVPTEVLLFAMAVATQLVEALVDGQAWRNPDFAPVLYAAPLLPLAIAPVLAWRRMGWGPAVSRLRRWALR